MPEPKIAQKGSYVLDTEAGIYIYCGCKHTKTPPYCDGTHTKL